MSRKSAPKSRIKERFYLQSNHYGFSLIELLVTVVILGILATLSTPVYSKYSHRAKIARSEADLESIRLAFMNHYYDSMLSGNREFPPAPSDNLMTANWSNTASLYDGKTPASLFSEGRVSLNPMGNPYRYILREDTGGEVGGFILEDPDIGTTLEFQP